MIAIAKASPGASTNSSAESEAASRDRFADMLPAIRTHLRFAFRHLDAESRPEAAQEAVAYAFLAFARLVQLDKADLAYPSVLAKFAVSHVRSGRSISRAVNVNDVMSQGCQSRRRFQVDQLDRQDDRGNWQELVIECRRAGPAETAATRLDVAAWLRTLPLRQRAIAQTLATGETTSATAKLFKVSAARISQASPPALRGLANVSGRARRSPLPNPA